MAKRIFLAQNPDREQGYKLLQEEFTYYPKNWKARLFKWFVGLRFGDYTPGKIRDEAYQLNAMYPDSCEIDYLCAEIFGRLNDKETRIYFLEKIVDQYKNCDLADEALFDLAELFPGKTLDYLENLLDKYPRSNRAMDARQRIAYITEYRDPDPKKYISNALAWINMQPTNPDPCFELAKYLLDHPDPRHDTLKYARKGLQLCLPGETPAKYLVILGKAYANQGNYKESEYYLMQALKINVSKKILYELIPVCKKNNSLDQLVPYIFKIHLEDIRDKDVFELLVSTLDEQLLQNKSFDMFYRVMMEKNSISVEDVYLAQVGADPVSFHQLAGRKTSIVYLWQPWNILSRHGLSYLSRLLQKNPGLNIYAIALNTEKETVTKFKHVIDPRVQVLFLKESSFGKWNTSSLPVILVANGNGKIIFVHNNIEEDTVGLLLEEVFMLDELGNNVPVSNVLGTK